ncbi:MAG: arsenate reductase (glutaredoxin) [Methylotenera sp.]
MQAVTIFHNPACGTSRNVLAMIRASGIEPEVVEYLRTPPSRDLLLDIIEKIGKGTRFVLREKATPYQDLALDNPSLSDEELVNAMLQHPILINRPIVMTDKGVKLCRPSEEVLSLLDNPVKSFIKEDGEIVKSA